MNKSELLEIISEYNRLNTDCCICVNKVGDEEKEVFDVIFKSELLSDNVAHIIIESDEDGHFKTSCVMICENIFKPYLVGDKAIHQVLDLLKKIEETPYIYFDFSKSQISYEQNSVWFTLNKE